MAHSVLIPITRPRPSAIIPGAKALTMCTLCRTQEANWLSKSSIGCSRTGCQRYWITALSTMMSAVPSSAATASRIASTDAIEVTSAWTVMARTPLDCSSASRAAARSSPRK